MSTWIDFKKLREEVKFEDVLRHYGVELKVNKGNQHLGFCPLPGHQGQRRSPSFSANLVKGIFNCFGCGAQGNMLDFAALMESLNPDNGADVRKAALKLVERFNVRAMPTKPKTRPEKPPEKPETPKSQVVVNAPLDFELKRLEADHPYLIKRGFTKETIERFGLGYCPKGLLAWRIAIPLHDMGGRLIGYAGRIVDDALIGEEHPKYRFPSKRERNGVIHEFHKLLFVYNGHRIKSPLDEIIVVEGFPSVWWLTQMGFPNTVALMGAAISEDQANIIAGLVSSNGRVWVFPDGDEAGGRCATNAIQLLASLRFVRLVKLATGRQPTDCSPEELGKLLGK